MRLKLQLNVWFSIILFVLLVIGLPLSAQAPTDPTDYPTLAALDAAPLPPRDRIALAQRLMGVSDIPTPPAAPNYEIGEQQPFYVIDSSAGETFTTTATLRAIGEHLYLWVEADETINGTDLQALVEAFDQRIYPNVRALWGSENTPGVDGDPRIHILFASHLGAGFAAYFSSNHSYPAEAVPNSNAREMFFFNLDGIRNGFSLPNVESVLAHEFQHMIRNYQHPNLDLWMNEGLSEFTQAYLYGDYGGSALAFLGTPDTQLNTWAEPADQRIYNYGAAQMFLLYLSDRFGVEAVQAAAAQPTPHALQAVDVVLRSMGQPGVEEFFADWVMANILFDTSIDDGRYGYQTITWGASIAYPEQTAVAYPFEASGEVRQYAADYILLDQLDGLSSLRIAVETPNDAALINTSDAHGRFWYSNRGDMSDTTLTRAFDLTGVSSATLDYRLWYHTERLWDFGYVMVSDDGGATWDILQTPHSTTENPHGAAYGPAYNGISGGGTSPAWVDESVSLDAYAGQAILVRFEMITDDGINQPGIAIDDVRIPEIGYSADFETDDGGWQPEGWLLTDNRLPQEFWLQAAQLNGADTTVIRWRAQGEGAWTLELTPGTQQVMLAISGLAPVTTVPMPYTISVSVG